MKREDLKQINLRVNVAKLRSEVGEGERAAQQGVIDSERFGLGNWRNHLGRRALRRHLARMMPQLRKRGAANSIC
jgi:hypothetical protein